MAGIKLFNYQLEALNKMKNGCILNGDVGSGKSRTGIAYYYIQNSGEINSDKFIPMKDPTDLYIITTAKKRDTGEWGSDLAPFLLSENPESNYYHNKVVVDSWNNISKYIEIEESFFIFDEQRVVGYGAWTKSFLKIAKKNKWILLTATPGDTWSDYIPVFIANGFYKNKTEFERRHVRWARFTKYPKIEEYLHTGELVMHRRDILVKMDFRRETVQHHEDIWCDYDKTQYRWICKERWNIWEDKPIKNASEFCSCLRKVVNNSESRNLAIIDIFEKKPKLIIFYNFDYELEALKNLALTCGAEYAEWNGHKHQEIPNGDKWMYFVQYMAGSEGWNYVGTDTIVFYSQNYSYKIMHQAAGRIDRLNTPFTDLYYYHLKSRSGIDLAISKALSSKKKFNENEFEYSKEAKEW